MTPRTVIFARLYGIALVAHVVGNSAQPDIPASVGWVNLAVGAIGIVLALKPRRSLLLAASALVVASVLLEMPFTGNHWVLAALVGIAILATRARASLFVPAARWILLIFYGFAAFAKLNSAFFDPSVSCAVFYANQSLKGFGLPSVDPGSPLAVASIWLVVGVELSVPILLALRRTRYLGVLLGTAFHTLISFDLNQHFYDFTSVLLALFFLFLPEESVERIDVAASQRSPMFRRSISRIWWILANALVIVAVLPLTPMTAAILTSLPFAVWIPFSLVWIGVLLWARRPVTAMTWNPGLAAGLVIAMAFLNGLTPYTEIKTAYGFSMYANLLTVAGDSNHLVVQRTLPLRHDYELLAEIVDTSDPGLDAYRLQRYFVALPQLRRYLSIRPEVSLTYRLGPELINVPRAGDNSLLSDPGPWWWRFFPLRAVDQTTPPRCQDVFLGAL